MAKKSATPWIVAGIVLVIAIIAVGFGAFKPSGNSVKNIPHPSSANALNVQSPSGSPSSGSGQLLSASQYAQYAYLVFPGTLSATAKTATIGFNIKENSNSNGSTTISFMATNPRFRNLSVTASSGEKVYFIETNPAEDHASTDQDSLYLDDKVIIVNSAGEIVSGPLQA